MMNSGPAASSVLSASLEGRRVLVVEDEYFVADDLDRALTGLGAEVLGPVPTVEEALEMLSNSSPVDLVVLDINLKGRCGLVVADELVNRRIPFVFATGYDEDYLPERFRHVPQWCKPFSAAALAARLVLLPDLAPTAGAHVDQGRVRKGPPRS